MKRFHYLLIIILVFGSLDLIAQPEKKITNAVRIEGKIQLDGLLDDEAWELAEAATDFMQTDPVFGEKPSQKTDVKLVYNDRGIYVGAMMYDTEPDKILKELSQRDRRGNTDWFGITFDTYQDGLNGFSFIVTASGVQQDIKFSGGFEEDSWDGIWESEVQFLDNGWSVEMFIPYLSLRFPNTEVQKWNVQFAREIRRFRENVFWNPVDPSIRGYINQAGTVEGISNIKTPVRLSVTPFVTGYINTESFPEEGIATTSSTAYTGGMDLKYGINDAFTVDMTLVPDFGQVISDNQVLNLSPFEVFFAENRQFFTEGVELFDKGNLFYTRRVGGTPFNYSAGFDAVGSDELLISNPDVVQLYNATKVSGRLASGTGLGLFNAVAGEEHAIIEDQTTKERRQVQTNPLTNYNVIVADQNLKNNSVVSFINTNVQRRGDAYDANTTGMFFNLRNKTQTYSVNGKAVLSNKFFTDGPDTGHSYSLGFGKVSGNWQYSFNYNEESDDYDVNDLGILFSPNERSIRGNFSYTDFKPKNQKLQRWEVGVTPFYSRLYDPNTFTDLAFRLRGFMLWKSRNAAGFNVRLEPVETFDYFEPRTSDFSKKYAFPTNFGGGGFFSSDYRKTFAFDVDTYYRKFSEDGRYYFEIEFEPRVRVNDKLSFFLSLEYSTSKNEVGYTDQGSVNDPIQGLSSSDVMFGRRDRQVIENSLRATYIFNNKMFLTARVRHYWDQVSYDSFNKLEDNGSLTLLSFNGVEDGEVVFDNNVNFFNIDLNYTWRFAKGSDMIFVWKQGIFDFNKELDSGYFTNFRNQFDAYQTNSFSLKIVYFLDYGTVFGK